MRSWLSIRTRGKKEKTRNNPLTYTENKYMIEKDVANKNERRQRNVYNIK